MSTTICPTCGQVQGIEAYDDALWDAYRRIPDGRSHREGLVFDGEWMNENVVDEEDARDLIFTMERDMSERGLCPGCGRPDLSGIDPADLLTDEEADARAEMEAERRAEQRMGA